MDIPYQLKTETVGQCEPDEPLCVEPTCTVREAMRQMTEHNRGAVVVCRERVVAGIFTERDALAMMAGGGDFDQAIERVMTPDPFVLNDHDTIGAAIDAMTHGRYRRLPIVDDQGRPTGIVRIKNILHYLAEHFAKVIYNLPPQPHYATQDREGA